MALNCPSCDEAAAEYVGMAEDGRNEMRCGTCGHHWMLGARPVSPRAVSQRPRSAGGSRSTGGSGSAGGSGSSRSTGGSATSRPATPRRRSSSVTTVAAPSAPPVRRFPTVDDVEPAALAALARRKAAFRAARPTPDPYVEDYRRLYSLMFSAAGLPHAEPQQLRAFATSSTLALPGNTTAFVREWNRLGDRDAARRFASVVEYLLRGDDEEAAREDRFTELCDPRSLRAMPGVRESILTRVLAVAEPERFLPILAYAGTQEPGKREIAAAVFALDMPAPDAMPIGRLVHRSNDLLVDLLGAGFADLDEAAAFLRWVLDQE